MKKYSSIILSITVLICINIGSLVWIRAFYHSARTYQTTLQQEGLPAQLEQSSKKTKVVIVLISGLSVEALDRFDWPVLKQLAQIGANSVIQSSPPTYSHTSWMTLITGASAELNGVPPIDRSFEALSPTQTDTIFGRAQNAGLNTALLGKVDWQRLIPRNQLDETFFIQAPALEADQAVVSTVLPLLNENRMDLVLIHFTGLDFAAKYQGGTNSSAYQQAATRLDDYIGQIRRTIDLNTTALIILGDHGNLASGGHGGAELEVTEQPLIFVGSGTTPGSYSTVSQTDVGPTVTTLLGTAPPASSQGRILFEILSFDEKNQALSQLALARQRVSLADTYVTMIESNHLVSTDVLKADLTEAESAFDRKNASGAFQLSLLTQKAADSAMAQARQSQIQAENWPHFLIAALVMLGWFAVLWRSRNIHFGLVVIAAIVTVGLYHVLFQVQGYSYSISSFNSLALLPFDVARRTVVSFLAGGAMVLVLLMLVSERDWRVLLETGYTFGMLVAFMFALPVAWAFLQNGFTIDWYLPSVNLVFWQTTGLLELMIATAIGLILPWPIMILNIFVNAARTHLDGNRSKSERDPLPGLR